MGLHSIFSFYQLIISHHTLPRKSTDLSFRNSFFVVVLFWRVEKSGHLKPSNFIMQVYFCKMCFSFCALSWTDKVWHALLSCPIYSIILLPDFNFKQQDSKNNRTCVSHWKRCWHFKPDLFICKISRLLHEYSISRLAF